MTPKVNPFAGFTSLSQNGNIYFCTAPLAAGTTTRAATSGLAPDLIVLSAWMGALPKHILKYTAAYQNIYTGATILVITNDPSDIVFRSLSLQQQRVAPAAEFVHTYRKEHAHARVLLHSFSNGGALQCIQLGRAYSNRYGQTLPVSAIALDSAPGSARGFKEGMTATLLAFPKSFRAIVTPIVFVLMCYFWVTTHVFGIPNVLDGVREGLLDKSLWPTTIPRVYMFSKQDQLVNNADVEEHAATAKRGGWPTELVEFTGSAHVTHMQKDPATYWGAISELVKTTDKVQRT